MVVCWLLAGSVAEVQPLAAQFLAQYGGQWCGELQASVEGGQFQELEPSKGDGSHDVWPGALGPYEVEQRTKGKVLDRCRQWMAMSGAPGAICGWRG